MLVAAAAQEWKVPAGEITVAKGVVSHTSGKKSTFGQLAMAASKQTPPADVKQKDPPQFEFMGNKVVRLHAQAQRTGKPQSTLDTQVPGTVTAMMPRPPMFCATDKRVDSTTP